MREFGEGGMAERKCVRVVVAGRVQGVGFRAFVERAARRLGLDGSVRNRNDGHVEAVFAGPRGHVDMMIEECRRGPPASAVTALDVATAEDPGRGFSVGPNL